MKKLCLLFSFILLSSANVSSIDKQLVSGILKNSPTQVQEAIKMGADPNQEIEKGRSLLMHVAYKKSYLQVKALVEAGAKVNYLGKNKETALLAATKSESVKIVEYLLSKGAKINHQNKAGTTALKTAVMTENIQMVELLLKKGADATMPGLGKKDIRGIALESDNPKLKKLFSK